MPEQTKPEPTPEELLVARRKQLRESVDHVKANTSDWSHVNRIPVLIAEIVLAATEPQPELPLADKPA